MNRHFIRGEALREYPQRVYARVDQVEPVNRDASETVTIGLDAVDADWPGFRSEGPFDLARVAERRAEIATYWRTRFGGRTSDAGADFGAMFDALPLYQVEVTLPVWHPWAEMLTGDARWLEFPLAPFGKVEVDVYGGLFAAPMPASIADEPMPAAPAAALDLLFDMDQWPDATSHELLTALGRGCNLERLIMLDIGQGSASALVCSCGKPRYYFDAGCGVYRNARTNPQTIEFCACADPVVILSHWDSDHWAGAQVDHDLLRQTWVAPRQSIGPRHAVFAQSILNAGGRLLIVPHALASITWGVAQAFDLRRCNGRTSDRNASGLVLIVEDQASGRAWLLTGDAPYHRIPGRLPSDLAAVLVPHHGADMGASSQPPSPLLAHRYSRLLYSFGPGNLHGRSNVQHPTTAAVNAHTNAGWAHGVWASSPPPPGYLMTVAPVLATALHSQQHLGGAAVGWTAPPLTLGLHAHCTKNMPVTQS